MNLKTKMQRVTQKINKLMEDEGIEGDAQVMLQNLSMTGAPDDDFLTQVYLKRAEYEAKDLKENYLCFVCGKTYDHPDDFTACFQSHIEDFMAGIPIKREEEHLDRIVQNIHPSHREKAKEVLRKQGL